MAIEPNLPIKDKKLESAAIAQVKAAVESQGKAVKEVKEALVHKPKVETSAEKGKLSKEEQEAARVGGSVGKSGSGGDSDPNATADGRGVKLNIET